MPVVLSFLYPYPYPDGAEPDGKLGGLGQKSEYTLWPLTISECVAGTS
jgi:hypothetical protein